MLSAGMTFGPYEIIGPLGLGCMDEVYRRTALARLLLPGREVFTNSGWGLAHSSDAGKRGMSRERCSIYPADGLIMCAWAEASN